MQAEALELRSRGPHSYCFLCPTEPRRQPSGAIRCAPNQDWCRRPTVAVQGNHIRCIVEAPDAERLGRAMKGMLRVGAQRSRSRLRWRGPWLVFW